ncbi:MAG: GIY-YIG nuclease family protein [Thermomicrobiales bacterium]
MNREERKAAIGAYKELKVEAGVFALRCTVDDRRWIGRAQNLATIENRLRFTLKRGKSPSASLQAAWTEHGDEAIVFEVIDVLDDQIDQFDRDRALNERQRSIAAELGAELI